MLVSMPFVRIDRPSIQLGLLKAIATEHGFAVHTRHANLDFAVRIGLDHYGRLAELSRPLLGDWLFALEAFGAAAPDPDGELAAGPWRDWLLRVREHDVPAFLDELVDEVPWQDHAVVGFSCSFQQSVASFALARRLKLRHPDIVTVFGGANFDGAMGPAVLDAVDCVDYAVIGEADGVFPALLEALAVGKDPTEIPGVASRARATPPAPPTETLDSLPTPDYGEYFEHCARLGLPTDDVWLPFESARGCWWGAKHHCTFCGLNGTSMAFRSKSAARVRDELAAQARRYGSFRFEAVDNILDMAYLTELFPAIAGCGHGYEFFYEVKANLTRAQLRGLAEGGVTELQPGLESLSSHVLALMDKGVRAAQNVNLLRWAKYYGITVAWSILYGFPGETEQDYADQIDVLPHLAHLQPPASVGQVWLERFSPMFTQPDRFPLGRRRVEDSYRYIYPSTADIEGIAYFFDYEPETAVPPERPTELAAAAQRWRDSWTADPAPSLTYRSSPGYLQIHDTRQPDRTGTYTFRDTLAEIYLACVERPITARAVHARLDLTLPVGAVADAFTQFRDRGLMFLDGTLALALALPAVRGR